MEKTICKTVEDLSPFVKNGLPFIRPGMSIEEFYKEKEYFGEHYQEYLDGTYVPLWKQKIDTTGQ